MGNQLAAGTADCNVLLLGETGVGKTYLLNMIVYYDEFHSNATIGRYDIKIEYQRKRYADFCEYGASSEFALQSNINNHLPQCNWNLLCFILSKDLWKDKLILYAALARYQFPYLCLIFRQKFAISRDDVQQILQLKLLREKTNIYFLFLDFNNLNLTIQSIKNLITRVVNGRKKF